MSESENTATVEIWKPIPGYEGYEVSDKGRVRSVARTRPVNRFGKQGERRLRPKIKRLSTTDTGHLLVNLNGEILKVHRLVLSAFVGPCPEGMEGCHEDGDPTNNRLDNLRWDTRAGNVGDAIRHGTMTINERNGNAILTNVVARQIKELLPSKSNIELGRMFGVARQTINSIRRGDSWKNI